MKLFTIISGFLAAGFANAATSQINYSNINQVVTDILGIPLTSGPDGNGNGAIIQIGYFTTTTATFQGDWVPITGLGSLNSGFLTTVGDGGDSTTHGIFSGEVVFNDNSPATSTGLPAAGAQLAIRFFNGTTLENSTHYNTVTSASWNFVAPATPTPLPETLDMDSDPLVWEDPNNAFRTGILIPEPSTMMLGALGALGLLRRRR